MRAERRDTASSKPVYANALLLLAAGGGAAAMLGVASSGLPFAARFAAALAFAFLNNTIFALMHEAVHGNFSRIGWINALGARLCAGFFPTSFTMQKAFHLTHHRNNRSDVERFDYVGPDDDVILKSAQWYTILTGLYWASVPALLIVLSLFAEVAPIRRLLERNEALSRQTSASAFLGAALELPIWRVRLDAVTTLLVQLALIRAMGVTLAGWTRCYVAFGLMWSSLQYADHAFSRLDREEGAWNLRVSGFTRALFLNYHYHRVHHRDPSVAWFALPRGVRATDESASFLNMLLLMWSGPRLLPGSGQSAARARRLDLASKIMQGASVALAFALVYVSADAAYPFHNAYFDVRVPLDARIPYIPAAGWIYATVAPLMACVIFMTPTSQDLTPYTFAFLTQIFIAGLFFFALPVAPFDADALVDPSGSTGLRIARAIALTGNYFPSLHVAFALTSAFICARYARSRALAALFWLWGAAVVASTLATRQHYILDVAAGAVLAAGAVFVVAPVVAARMRAAEAEINAAATPA